MQPAPKPTDIFTYRDMNLLLGSAFLNFLSITALYAMVQFRIYDLTGSKSALGTLGIAEAIPTLSLLLLGGHVADSGNRKNLLLLATAMAASAVWIVAGGSMVGFGGVWIIYACIIMLGFSRGLYSPAFNALEAQVLPVEVAVAASGLVGSLMSAGGLIGPADGGALYKFAGTQNCFIYAALGLTVGHVVIWRLGHYPNATKKADEKELGLWASIHEGWMFVRRSQILLGSMALDLFAVLFGGAVALIPVFAKDILHVDSFYAGILASATAFGALIGMILSNKFKVTLHAGRNLLITIFLFGISILVFAFSHNFWLSFAAMALSGVFDGFSMVIRRVLFRVTVPNELRGRVGAVNMMFIGASNEIGAAESGYAAQWLGTVPSVATGAILCLGIVGYSALFAKELRGFKVDLSTSQN